MKKYAGWMCACICLVLTGLLLWNGVQKKASADILEKNVTLLLSEPLTVKMAARMQETEKMQGQETLAFTAWQEESGQQLTAENTKKTAKANILWIYGSSELLMPYGKILHPEDIQGCLMDEVTAEELFGSRQAEGMKFRTGEGTWVVRDVFSAPSRLVILQDKRGEQTEGFYRITLQRMTKKSVKSQGEDFCMRHNISGTVIRWDLKQSFSWLEELVPTKWSDFSGWCRSLEKNMEERRLLSGMERSTLELEYEKMQRNGLACILAGSICLFVECFYFIGILRLILKNLFTEFLHHANILK